MTVERPPVDAPGWFVEALAHEPDRSRFEVRGCPIELLTWGPPGKPGLLFLHGNGAHADWWRFIAPFFAHDHRVAAISWSGMGGSGHRERYAQAVFLEEIAGAIEAAGLRQAGRPIIVAHSFGGFPALSFGAARGAELDGLIVVDTAIRSDLFRAELIRRRREQAVRPNRRYLSLAEALAHYRLRPAQNCENAFILSFIARHSLHRLPASDEFPAGWCWRFDPGLWQDYEPENPATQLSRLACRFAFVYGEQSSLIDPEVLRFIASHAPPGSPLMAIPRAAHHLMLDQPLAFVAAVRAQLANWRTG